MGEETQGGPYDTDYAETVTKFYLGGKSQNASHLDSI